MKKPKSLERFQFFVIASIGLNAYWTHTTSVSGNQMSASSGLFLFLISTGLWGLFAYLAIKKHSNAAKICFIVLTCIGILLGALALSKPNIDTITKLEQLLDICIDALCLYFILAAESREWFIQKKNTNIDL
jgi:hypothetical protein